MEECIYWISAGYSLLRDLILMHLNICTYAGYCVQVGCICWFELANTHAEFVKIYSQMFGPLSSDAYSSFTAGTDSDEADKYDINHATEYLLTEHLPLFLERFHRFNAIDPFAWLELLHTHGINYRHMGALRQLVLRLPAVPNYTNCDTHILVSKNTMLYWLPLINVDSNGYDCTRCKESTKLHHESAGQSQLPIRTW